VTQDLGRVLSAVRHLLGLIQEVLDLSNVEAGQIGLNLTWCDVGALIRDSADTMAPCMARNQNTLTLVSPEPLGAFEVDAQKRRQCLFNLLSNAGNSPATGQ
jgi:signal transduction histidine kinase